MADEQETQQQKDLAGYPDEQALVQGYRSSSQEAQRQKNRADVAEAALAAQMAAANPRQDIHRRPADRLSDLGVPVDALDEYVQERIQGAFQPLMRGIEARTNVVGAYPDYAKFESNVAQFVQSDPVMHSTYQRMFNSDPAGAMEWAYLKYGNTQRQNQPGVEVEVAKRTRRQAVDASVPSNGGGGSGAGQGDNGLSEYMAKAREHYEKTGDAKPFAKARLRQVIKDEFLNQ